MRHMKLMPAKAVPYFVAELLTRVPPVFWGLVLPPEGGPRFEEVGPVRRRPDSNTLEINFPEANYATAPDSRLFQEFEGMVRRYAEAEDDRDLRAIEGPLPAGVGFELESRVPTMDDGRATMLEVIGAGGRATAFLGAKGLGSADVTIRRRTRAEQGKWRRTREILKPLDQVLGEDFAGTDEQPSVRAAFGYFELSKFEAQSLMRPVFLFAIEQEQDPEGRWPGFQRIVVSPATTAEDFDDAEGLGIWAESTLCSG